MNFNEYQEESKRTMQYSGTVKEIISNICMGIAGEAGELVDYMKKVLYFNRPMDSTIRLKEEMGDLLFYMASLAEVHGFNLEDVAILNIEKLNARYPNGFNFEDANKERS